MKILPCFALSLVAATTPAALAQSAVVDLAGRTVVPGLNDSHTNFRAAGKIVYRR